MKTKGIEEMIKEIADNFGGDNIHYHAGRIRGLLIQYGQQRYEEGREQFIEEFILASQIHGKNTSPIQVLMGVATVEEREIIKLKTK